MASGPAVSSSITDPVTSASRYGSTGPEPRLKASVCRPQSGAASIAAVQTDGLPTTSDSSATPVSTEMRGGSRPGDSLTIDHGWRDVADIALPFVKRVCVAMACQDRCSTGDLGAGSVGCDGRRFAGHRRRAAAAASRFESTTPRAPRSTTVAIAADAVGRGWAHFTASAPGTTGVHAVCLHRPRSGRTGAMSRSSASTASRRRSRKSRSDHKRGRDRRSGTRPGKSVGCCRRCPAPHSSLVRSTLNTSTDSTLMNGGRAQRERLRDRPARSPRTRHQHVERLASSVAHPQSRNEAGRLTNAWPTFALTMVALPSIFAASPASRTTTAYMGRSLRYDHASQRDFHII